ncbi:hypothetical protein JVU11DRAFT_8521 [Chiua virens]|nr:hypothetical protein JVU11DRAFT_8521 [Chiua virens]
MLVLGLNSTCDVCLECYTSGANVPHAITCGHVFCQKCLDHLMQHKCPLCRERFSPRDIRKLHVDRDASIGPTQAESSSESVVAPQIDNESQRLLDDIARIVKEGGKVNEIRRVIDECRAYYKSLPGNQYTPVRVSCLLLHNLLEAQRKLVAQADQLRETSATRDEIRDRLTSGLEALPGQFLERMESVNQECRSLREELERLRSSGMTMPPPPRAVELQYFYGPKRSYSGKGDLTLSKVEMAKGKVIDDDCDFHLSPLVEVTAPLMSTAPSLMALADDSDQDDIVKAKRVKSPIQEETEPESELEDSGNATAMAYPFPAHLQPQPNKVEPIPIPSRTPPSRQSSDMAMSVTADRWPSNISCSKPRDDVVMSSRPPSPPRRHSGDRMAIQGPRPNKDTFTREMTDLKRRDSTTEVTKDHLVSRLHDLLDSPKPTSSLHAHMQRTDFLEPTLPRPISRLTTPSRPSSTAQLPSSSSTAIAHYPDEASNALDRKPLVRASDVAMQLEKERLERLEKERRRLREASTLSNSLKDATNVSADAYHLSRHRSHDYGGSKSQTKAPTATLA